ncbi:MAG: hypothetical protein H0U92_11065 [Actinobacteria bacterium]|nr:hypothetical protein [Actinomycetota bacterium]
MPSFEPPTLAPAARIQLAVRVPPDGRGAVNKKVIVHLDRAFVVDACSSRDGWTCTITLATKPPRSLVTYEWKDAAVRPSSDTVQFALRTPRADAIFRVEVDQFHTDGHVVYWGGSSVKAAPTLTIKSGVAPTTTAQVADRDSGVANTDDAKPVPKKKDFTFMALYIVIALWLAVVIPVLIAGMKGAPQDEAHTHDQH